MLDEPLSGMNAAETDDMLQTIRSLRHNGLTVLVIEHNIRAVMTLCDRIVVLNFGSKIFEGSPDEVRSNTQVIQAYFGVD
jgi:branched-chain amino acid transport system ATP-binding protein